MKNVRQPTAADLEDRYNKLMFDLMQAVKDGKHASVIASIARQLYATDQAALEAFEREGLKESTEPAGDHAQLRLVRAERQNPNEEA